jgi:transposase-like protein
MSMNPHTVFCPNLSCPARGQQGKGNVGVHSEIEHRYICHECDATFSATKGTIFYRLRTDAVTVMLVITLMAYGCPVPAIVKAFGFDERTVKSWWQRAGVHCQAVHEEMVEQQQLDLKQVQADEIKVKMQGRSVWMALAMMVDTRLWLTGAISQRRDKRLIERIAVKVRQMALCRPLLLAVDGFASYVGAFQTVFRSPLPRHGRRGRPRLFAWPDVAIVQVVKHRSAGDWDIQRRIVQGSQQLIEQLLLRSQGRGVINTAYIERFNGTFRQRLSSLARRTRCPAQQIDTLTAGMYVVGCLYNLCDTHRSLRQRLWIDERRYRWVQLTPAMAARLTDHIWTIQELFWFRVPPPTWSPPKRRGRPSKETLRLVEKWCS